jgi:hypothetical protein
MAFGETWRQTRHVGTGFQWMQESLPELTDEFLARDATPDVEAKRTRLLSERGFTT